ncbi:hypothetical protein CIPAW_06G149600 [Carya illinoinensis]|uniref:Uncharacterized protein n=1 Tax=Carya illinoinensis TaxID=32201 RepID=A0A8T1QCG0_CARIL|nr:hypothetical protein CIPAW_06G149600 [Carya illinoinensis]
MFTSNLEAPSHQATKDLKVEIGKGYHEVKLKQSLMEESEKGNANLNMRQKLAFCTCTHRNQPASKDTYRCSSPELKVGFSSKIIG